MKALSMLDHVKLWIARAFAIFVLAHGLYSLVRLYLVSDADLGVPQNLDISPASVRAVLFHASTHQILLGALFVICLFVLQSRIARVLLGMTAGYEAVRGLMSLFPILYNIRTAHPLGMACLLLAILTLSILMNLLFIWIAVLPPITPKDSEPHLPDSTNLVHPV